MNDQKLLQSVRLLEMRVGQLEAERDEGYIVEEECNHIANQERDFATELEYLAFRLKAGNSIDDAVKQLNAIVGAMRQAKDQIDLSNDAGDHPKETEVYQVKARTSFRPNLPSSTYAVKMNVDPERDFAREMRNINVQMNKFACEIERMMPGKRAAKAEK